MSRRRRTGKLHPVLCLTMCTTALAWGGRASSAEPPSTADAAPAASAASTPVVDFKRVYVPGSRYTDIGPLPGLAVTRDQIPANIQSATKQEIKDARSLNIGDFMNTQLQGVSVNDYAGNPFQLDVNYRGFTASPQIGTPQGLSVFLDGIRVNEPFGDVVNWDLLPLNAIERFDLFPGSNPVFGLNTLGGAISIRTKSGFTAPGLEGEVMGGSWGRRQIKLSGGANNGALGGFFALTRFDESGWRDNSPSRVQQLFGRGDWRVEHGSLYTTMLLVDNRLIGNGLIPIELYRERPEAVFTSPDESKNRLTQLALGGDLDLAEKLTLTGQVYHRKSDRRGVNGDVYEGFDDFDSDHDNAVGSDGLLISRNGAYPQTGEFLNSSFSRAGYVDGTPIGLVTRTELNQSTNGGALQFNWNLDVHKFLVGASIDRNRTTYGMAQQLGLIDATHNVYIDPAGVYSDYVASQREIPGNSFSGTSTTKSLYLNETWTPVRTVTLTAAARYNHTVVDNDLSTRSSEGQVDLHELRGFRDPAYTGAQAFDTTRTHETFTYKSFNPSIGANWRPLEGLNLFGNLGRGARTPSVVELGCAFDSTPVLASPALPQYGYVPRSLRGPGCNLPTTLSGDPYLPQIRATSGELGLRHQLTKDWEWNASVYRTDLKDDIYFVGVGDGKSYFDTIGKTRRQGMELGVKGKAGPVDVKASYSYTDATFQSTFYTVSPHNSSADFDQNSGYYKQLTLQAGLVGLPTPNASKNREFGTYHMIQVDPGARLPGIPAHAVNLNLALHPVANWKVGLGMTARSLSYMRGNENNLHQPAGTDQEIGQYFCSQGDPCAAHGYLQAGVRAGRPFTDAGTVPGYALFNLDTSVQISKRLSLFAQVTNLFDRETFSAGRLGVNPFSPSVNGAIGPSGWNYNSSEWQNTSFVAPGAPRGIFVGLNWELGTAH